MNQRERITKGIRELIKTLAISQNKHPRDIQDEMLAHLQARKAKREAANKK